MNTPIEVCKKYYTLAITLSLGPFSITVSAIYEKLVPKMSQLEFQFHTQVNY